MPLALFTKMFSHKWSIGSNDEHSLNAIIKIVLKFAYKMEFLVEAMFIENTLKLQTAFIILTSRFVYRQDVIIKWTSIWYYRFENVWWSLPLNFEYWGFEIFCTYWTWFTKHELCWLFSIPSKRTIHSFFLNDLKIEHQPMIYIYKSRIVLISMKSLRSE